MACNVDPFLAKHLVKPDVVAPSGFHDGSSVEQDLDSLIPMIGLVSCYSRDSIAFDSLDPTGRTAMSGYTRIWGTSQATAVMSGLAALLLSYGNSVGLNFGHNVGSSLAAILRYAASKPKVGETVDYGSGRPLWPQVLQIARECATDDVRRLTVLEGTQLELHM